MRVKVFFKYTDRLETFYIEAISDKIFKMQLGRKIADRKPKKHWFIEVPKISK